MDPLEQRITHALQNDASALRLLQQQACHGIVLADSIEVVQARSGAPSSHQREHVRLQVFFQSIEAGCACSDDVGTLTTRTESGWLEAHLAGSEIEFRRAREAGDDTGAL